MARKTGHCKVMGSIPKNSKIIIVFFLQEVAALGTVKTVQIKGPNSGWQGMNNIWGAMWEATSQPSLPIDLRIQAQDGTEVSFLGLKFA